MADDVDVKVVASLARAELREPGYADLDAQALARVVMDLKARVEAIERIDPPSEPEGRP